MRSIKHIFITLAALLAFAAPAAAIAAPAGDAAAPAAKASDVSRQVQHRLLTLPYYGVFDNLAYKVEGGTVVLYGQVVRPSTRSDAGREVARIPGVQRVVNNIEVLPPSSMDDAIRMRTYRAIFGTGGLYRYGMGANPSIHIVVDNGQVTLEGVVGNRADSQLAYIAASGVPGVFSVTNHLQVERGGTR